MLAVIIVSNHHRSGDGHDDTILIQTSEERNCYRRSILLAVASTGLPLYLRIYFLYHMYQQIARKQS